MEIKNFTQNPTTTTTVNIVNRKKIYLIGSIVLIFILLAGGIFAYLRFYRERDLYPKTNVSIDENRFTGVGFKKITSSDKKSSFFVPEAWTDIDLELEVYGDVLTGANAYIQSYPNNLGLVNNDTCREFSTQSFNKFSKTKTYSNTSLADAKVIKVKDYEVCEMNLNTTLGGKEFSVKQRYFFLKDRIYMFYLQLPKDMLAKDEKQNLILESISIED